MKNRGRNLFRIIVAILGIALFCYFAVWLVDQRLNGIFADLLYSRKWFAYKRLFIVLFVAVTYGIALCIALSSYFYARSQKKRQIAFLAKSIASILESDGDGLVLPKEYFEIETQIIKMKTEAQRHQQLVQTETQRKNDLITYLAHDLKTPLASIIGYLSLLDEAPNLPTEQRAKYVGIALGKAYRLEELIGEFFDITRFNLQSIVLNTEKINLPYMLRQMADEFYPMLATEDKAAEVDAPDELTIAGDSDKLARVFNNILKNAVAYSYNHSTIVIRAVQNGGDAVIDFTNQGDPIPARQLHTIFEKFYRLDSARSTHTGGAGLGLAIAKDIVTAHGGTISVESNTECTKFTVVLPIAPVLK